MPVAIHPSLPLTISNLIIISRFKRLLKRPPTTQRLHLHARPHKKPFRTQLPVTGMNNNNFNTCRLPGYIITFNSCFSCHLKEIDMDLDSFIEDEMVRIKNWLDLKAPKVEELSVEITSKTYSLPEFINKMDHLKVLSITGHGDYPSKLNNLSFVTRLPDLTTIRFKHVSVPSLQPVFALTNLTCLEFNMCKLSDALMNFTTDLPNLTSLEFNMCYDLKQLPSILCNLVHLQKLSITNCNELDALPERLGDLSNLESLNLRCCTKLQELPASIGSLRNLSLIDISDCLSISVLPEEIGELCGLRVLKMNGCTGLQELPMSMSKLEQLEEVVCDEETSYLWMDFERDLYNLKIDVVEDDRLESFMKIVQ